MRRITWLFFLLPFSLVAQEVLLEIPGIQYLDHNPTSEKKIFTSFITQQVIGTESQEDGKRAGNQFEIRWLKDNNKVRYAHQFEKLELGLKFRIAQYVMPINAYLSGKQNQTTINPYDRGDLNIQVDFYHLTDSMKKWEGPWHKEAFYFQDFERKLTEDIKSSGWVEKMTSHPFRVRFTPREQGQWMAIYKVDVQGKNIGQAFFPFIVLPSQDSTAQDFVFKNESNNYFSSRDAHNKKESYVGLGQNLPTPTCVDCDIPCAGIEAYCAEFKDKPILPQVYIRFLEEVEDIANNGATIFRTLMAPYNWEIEFEKLNNYTNRLNCAWEMDQLLETARENDIRIHMNLQVHYPFEMPNVYGQTLWDWPNRNDKIGCYDPNDEGNCYRDELNLDESIYFLTDERAKYHYKNRLRYIISRYGYSPNIALFEMFSEVNGFGGKPKMKLELKNGSYGCYAQGGNWGDDYYRRDSVPGIVQSWHEEMIGYIKNELGHHNHLFSVSYAGDPHLDPRFDYVSGCDVAGGDSSYFSPLVDIFSFNSYSNNVIKVANPVAWNKRYQYFFDKPFIISETGPSDEFMYCDSLLSYKDEIIFSPFTGLSNMTLNWSHAHNKFGQWKYFQFMKDFLSPLDFENENFISNVKYNDNETAIMVYLDGEGKKAEKAGAIANLTVNYFTKSTGSPCSDSAMLYPNKEIYKSMQSLEMDREFQFDKMGVWHSYEITYYYPLTGDTIKVDEQRSNLFGKLKLNIPELGTNIDKSRIVFHVKSIKDYNFDFEEEPIDYKVNSISNPEQIEWTSLQEGRSLPRSMYTLNPVLEIPDYEKLDDLEVLIMDRKGNVLRKPGEIIEKIVEVAKFDGDILYFLCTDDKGKNTYYKMRVNKI